MPDLAPDIGPGRSLAVSLQTLWLWVRRIVFLAAIGLLIRLVVKNISQVQTSLLHLNYLFFLSAISLAGCSFFLSSLAWRSLLSAQGTRLGIRLAWWSSTYSFLIRYLPGIVPGLAARLDVMRQFGVRLSHGGWNLMIEMGVSACAALVFFLVGGRAMLVPGWVTTVSILGLVFGAAALMLLTSRRRAASVWRTRLRLPALSPGATIIMFVWLLAAWFTLGWAQWFLVRAIGLEKNIGFWPLTGTFALSWVAGLVAIFAPAGIGVREGVMIALLQPTLGAGAITIALLSRLTLVGGEFFNLVAALIMKPRKGSL